MTAIELQLMERLKKLSPSRVAEVFDYVVLPVTIVWGTDIMPYIHFLYLSWMSMSPRIEANCGGLDSVGAPNFSLKSSSNS